MFQSRNVQAIRKSKIILDKRFGVFSELEVGDKGQMQLFGSVDSERIEPDENDNEIHIKTIMVDEVKVINQQSRKVI